MKNLFIVAISAILFVACSQTPEQRPSIDFTSAEFFGEAFEAEVALSVDDALAQITSETPVELIVGGEVLSVCQQKGCWMKMQATDGREMRVKFKDYDFFVPKDGAGSSVVFRGEGYLEETSVVTLRHYAEDAGKTQEEIEAITEPKVEYIFVATGVAFFI